MADGTADLSDALTSAVRLDLTAAADLGEPAAATVQPTSRLGGLAATSLVTKTVRRWSVDHKENSAAINIELDGGTNAAASAMLSSALPSHLAAENLILKGLKRRPTRAQTATSFYSSITHLHLDGQGLTGDVEPLKVCLNLQVLYLYDNKLTSLRGLGSLKRLTHLYAQSNDIESLDDFTAPPALQQLFLNGNMLLDLDDDDLGLLGVTNKFHRRRMFLEIEKLRRRYICVV